MKKGNKAACRYSGKRVAAGYTFRDMDKRLKNSVFASVFLVFVVAAYIAVCTTDIFDDEIHKKYKDMSPSADVYTQSLVIPNEELINSLKNSVEEEFEVDSLVSDIDTHVEETEYNSTYTDWDKEILSIIIYQEAGSDACSDDTRLKVGSVFMNRVESDLFPNTFEEVAIAESQYGRLYWTGIQWSDRASLPEEERAVQRARDIAERILNGERGFDTNDVIWQAEFVQGNEIVAFQDGIYFCR